MAITMGPVPNNFNMLFETAFAQNLINCKIHPYNDFVWEQFTKNDKAEFKANVFSNTELSAMHMVIKAFEYDTARQIVDKSHEELAWLKNEETRATIDYKFAFSLKYPVAEWMV